jgi:hypothetical protein
MTFNTIRACSQQCTVLGQVPCALKGDRALVRDLPDFEGQRQCSVYFRAGDAEWHVL